MYETDKNKEKHIVGIAWLSSLQKVCTFLNRNFINQLIKILEIEECYAVVDILTMIETHESLTVMHGVKLLQNQSSYE